MVNAANNNVLLPNTVQFQSPQPPQQPPPMMIGPGVMGDMSMISSKEASSSTSNDHPSQWSEHLANDGRTYYYNKVLQFSSWSKPDALKTPEEVKKQLKFLI